MKRIFLIITFLLCSCIQYPEQSNPASTPTYPPIPVATELSGDNSCPKDQVTSYINDVDTAMKKVTKLANDFGQTQNQEQALSINKKVEDMFTDINLWRVPDCATNSHVSLLLVVVNIKIMQQDILRNDMASFDNDYKDYEVAVKQLNADILKLGASVNK